MSVICGTCLLDSRGDKTWCLAGTSEVLFLLVAYWPSMSQRAWLYTHILETGQKRNTPLPLSSFCSSLQRFQQKLFTCHCRSERHSNPLHTHFYSFAHCLSLRMCEICHSWFTDQFILLHYLQLRFICASLCFHFFETFFENFQYSNIYYYIAHLTSVIITGFRLFFKNARNSSNIAHWYVMIKNSALPFIAITYLSFFVFCRIHLDPSFFRCFRDSTLQFNIFGPVHMKFSARLQNA